MNAKEAIDANVRRVIDEAMDIWAGGSYYLPDDDLKYWRLIRAAVDERDALKRDLLDAYAAATEKNKELETMRKGFKALYDSYYPDQQYEAFEDMYTRLECAFCDMRARAEKAEAELSAMRSEADAARPLLEAVERAALVEDDGSWRLLADEVDWDGPILRAALAYREGKEKP